MDHTLRIVGGNCTDTNTCPTVIADPHNGDNVVVQGYKISDQLRARLELPDSDDAVVFPRVLLEQILEAATPAEAVS